MRQPLVAVTATLPKAREITGSFLVFYIAHLLKFQHMKSQAQYHISQSSHLEIYLPRSE